MQTIVSASLDKSIAIWEWEKSNSPIAFLEGHDDWVQSIAVSNAGDRFFCGSQDRTVRFWDLTLDCKLKNLCRAVLFGLLLYLQTI